LDDFAFTLSKIGVFGKRMQRACMTNYFRAEFSQKRIGKKRYVSIMLKAMTFINISIMLALVINVTIQQTNGHYYQSSISVDFGNTIWDTAWAQKPWYENSTQYEDRVLICKLLSF
jgi:hypothetical protein